MNKQPANVRMSLLVRLRDRGWNVFLAMLLMVVLAHAAHGADLKRLNILLTNDDGYQAVGIVTMKQALQRAGHKVTMVAPLTQRSGSSAALTIDRLLYKKLGNDTWAVDATPFSCVLVGLSAIFDEAPDLVLSGTNVGSNLGPATILSGTVGGALAGVNAELVGLPRSVPAIAFSTDAPVSENEDPAGYRKHFENVAAFAITLIDKLTVKDGPLLPTGTMLNVNYPPRAPEKILGVKHMTQDDNTGLKLDFVEESNDNMTAFVTKFNIEDGLDAEGLPSSEVTAYGDGYITVVPLDGNYTADRTIQNQVKARLGGLKAQSSN